LVNRPGRFHYHFRFEYPSPAEIEEYLKDKIPEEMYGEIPPIINFSRKVDLNYDSLRALAFEISSGLKFSEAIEDLNIINYNDLSEYNITLEFTNGESLCYRCARINMFKDESSIDSYWLNDGHGRQPVAVDFDTCNCQFSENDGCYIIKPDGFQLHYDHDEGAEKYKTFTPKVLTLKRRMPKSLRYAV